MIDLKKLQTLKKVKEDGTEHGLVSILSSDVRQKKEDPKERKRDEEIIKARYVNRKNPKGKLERPYLKYPGDYLTKWVFYNNEIYDVPRGLVDDTNAMHTRAKKRSQILDTNSVPLPSDQPLDIEHEFVGVL